MGILKTRSLEVYETSVISLSGYLSERLTNVINNLVKLDNYTPIC